MKIRKMQNAGIAETPHVDLPHQTTPIDNLHHYLYTPSLGEIKIAPEGSSAAYLKNQMLNVDINEIPFTTLPTEQYSLRDVQKMAKDDFERGIDGGIAKYDITNPGEINSDENWDYEYWAHRTGLKDNIKKRYINRLIKLHKKDPISAGSLLAKYQRDGKVPTNYVLPKTSDGETARQNLTSYYSSPQYGLNKAFYDKVNDFAWSSVAVAGMGAANHALKLYKPLNSLKTGPKTFVSPFAKPSMGSHFGKQFLKGALDYALADTAVTGVTGKSIIDNINNTVKLIGGDNKVTDVIANYVTPFAPIPIFGTGNFRKNVVGAGKNIYNKVIDGMEDYIVKQAFKNKKLYFGLPTIFDQAHHQSNLPITEFKFPYYRWDVVRHGADPNAAFFTWGDPASEGFLSKRPWDNEFVVFAQRPLIQRGEIRGVAKNSIRNKIVKEARKRGADAVLFDGISDNQLKNQQILMAFDNANISHVRSNTKDWSTLSDDQWDLLYNKAISNNDLDEVQKLRDLHFLSKTPNNIFVENNYPMTNYHGSPYSFNEFSLGHFGKTDLGDHGVGFYFSPKEDYAILYGDTRPFYLYATTPYVGARSRFLNRGPKYNKQHLIDRNRIAMDRDSERTFNHMLQQQKSGEHSIMYDELGISENMTEQEIRNRVKNLYDKRHKEYIEQIGNIGEADSYMSTYENVLWNNKHIKLKDPITYDDAGNIIPLSKRDDFTNPDIRYAIAPTLGLSLLGLDND